MSDADKLILNYKIIRARLVGIPYAPPPPPKRDEVAELKAHYLAVRKRLRGEPERLLPPVVTIVSHDAPLRMAVERTPEQDRLLRAVCTKHGVTPNSVLGKSQQRAPTKARHEYVWLLKKELGMSLRQIGALIDKNWSTVSDAIEKHERRINESA
jgi:hypothetical protein